MRPTYFKVYDRAVTSAQRVSGILEWLTYRQSSVASFYALYFDVVDSQGIH
jgi:hypothetical protein